MALKMIVCDASSLILLSKAGLASPLTDAFKVVVPEHVYRECVSDYSLRHFPDALAIQQWAQDKVIEIKKVQSVKKIDYLHKLGPGEKEAIELCMELPGSILLTDDGDAVRAARYLRVPFIISPVVAVDLFKLGKISFERAKQAIEKLSIIGRYVPNIIADALIMLQAAAERERK
ncbi:MAG: hypothetical protein HY587_02750 [Candidatus Omnitrophica bacterium]|nr:hypothetical protein [Candidatus Omnitrophota bacterium]